jgi:quercetin dioxygenase-like cupin family protein
MTEPHLRPSAAENSNVLHVIRLKDIPALPIRELTGHPRDQGINWELISRDVCGAAEFQMGLYQLSVNEYHPKHVHTGAAEFYYVTEGSCLFTVGEDEVEAAQGTALYIPPGLVHAIRTRANETMTMVYGFSTASFEDCGTEWLE